ncbi:MAG: T9SS type A sorting domain-containing protein [candidate division WOR-3 bacterium]|nr:T9SS type A sorting domain-containing protein [candidate division WOR-3 bacterium]
MAKTATCLAIVLVLCITTHEAYPFQLKSDILSSGGTTVVSTGFVAEGTLSQFTASSPWLTSSGFQAVIGFWHPFVGGPGIDEHYENLGPSAYVNFLYSNDPNPACDHTVIQYSIAREGRVRLEVYNTLGQRVTSLVDGTQSPGMYKVAWNFQIDRLPAGVYFYRLKTVDYTKIKKMVVVH